MKDTIIIMGSHPGTRNEFDFNRTDCDIWVFNETISRKIFPRADAVFQMHPKVIWKNPLNRNDPGHFNWLSTQTETPVYMQEQYPEVPAAIAYPLHEIVDRFKISFFTSSISYALALACYKGYKRIEIYGVEMESNTEYQYQRDAVTLWIGVALGLGIEVDAHISMLTQPLYGYDGDVVVDYHRFEERIKETLPLIEDASKIFRIAKFNVSNAVKDLENDGSKDNEDALYKTVGELVQAADVLGVYDGIKQENERYKTKADTMKDNSDGQFLFSRQEFETAAKRNSDLKQEKDTEFISLGTTLAHIHRNAMQAAKGSPKRHNLFGLYLQTLDTYLKAKNAGAIYAGAAKENFAYMQWLDEHIRAAGGEKSEAVMLEAMQNA